ncbi:MAG TPA: hypothetical protein VJZ71_03500 [Phycisphaerae bacterium]|nr:hypothetical protein [Phycisphaerae bacterium]
MLQYSKKIANSVLLSAVLMLTWFIPNTSVALQDQPPPDDRRADDGPDGPSRAGPDDRRFGPRDDRPRDRLRRWRENRGPDGMGPNDGLPPEMIERILDMLRDNFPEYHARLIKRREQNPEMFRGAVRRIVPIFKEYMLLKDEKPELAAGIIEEFKNERKLGDLSRRYREAAKDPAAQSAIAGEIEPLVRRQIDLHHQRMAFRLEQFEKRIQEQQAALERQRKHHEEAGSKLEEQVARRVEEIKKGELRRPFDRRGPGPGGPDGFGEDPPRGRHGPDDGSPRGRRGPRPDRPDGPPPQEDAIPDED